MPKFGKTKGAAQACTGVDQVPVAASTNSSTLGRGQSAKDFADSTLPPAKRACKRQLDNSPYFSMLPSGSVASPALGPRKHVEVLLDMLHVHEDQLQPRLLESLLGRAGMLEVGWVMQQPGCVVRGYTFSGCFKGKPAFLGCRMLTRT